MKKLLLRPKIQAESITGAFCKIFILCLMLLNPSYVCAASRLSPSHALTMLSHQSNKTAFSPSSLSGTKRHLLTPQQLIGTHIAAEKTLPNICFSPFFSLALATTFKNIIYKKDNPLWDPLFNKNFGLLSIDQQGNLRENRLPSIPGRILSEETLASISSSKPKELIIEQWQTDFKKVFDKEPKTQDVKQFTNLLTALDKLPKETVAALLTARLYYSTNEAQSMHLLLNKINENFPHKKISFLDKTRLMLMPNAYSAQTLQESINFLLNDASPLTALTYCCNNASSFSFEKTLTALASYKPTLCLPPQEHDQYVPFAGQEARPNCAEATLKGFFDLIFAGPNANFDLSFISKDISPSPALRNFYTKFADFQNVNRLDSATHWMAIISGHESISYNKSEGENAYELIPNIPNMLQIINKLLGTDGITTFEELGKKISSDTMTLEASTDASGKQVTFSITKKCPGFDPSIIKGTINIVPNLHAGLIIQNPPSTSMAKLAGATLHHLFYSKDRTSKAFWRAKLISLFALSHISLGELTKYYKARSKENAEEIINALPMPEDKHFKQLHTFVKNNEEQSYIHHLIALNSDQLNNLVDNAALLHYASMHNNLESIQELITFKANPNIANSIGETPLMVACTSTAALLLLENGADIDLQNNWGETALIRAIVRKNTDAAKNKTNLVQLLIEKGASIDIQDASGKTALMHAIEKKDKLCIALLLKHNARLDLKNKMGINALYIAEQNGLSEFINICLNTHSISSQAQPLPEKTFPTILSRLLE
jgi:hypothetical protein